SEDIVKYYFPPPHQVNRVNRRRYGKRIGLEQLISDQCLGAGSFSIPVTVYENVSPW
uniref:Uncharacterized protein n=1 Tax=Callorhinchus milii TaxID=7868 RepID=A0A4W3JCQ1_CALMI